MPIPFHTDTTNVSAPASGGFNVTPTDGVALVARTRAVYVGTGGNLSVVFMDDTALVITNVQDGSVLPIRVKEIKSTGTTASGIQGWY